MTENTHNYGRTVATLCGVQIVLSIITIVLLICVLVGVNNHQCETIDIFDEPTTVGATAETEEATEITECTTAPTVDETIVPEIEETIPATTEPIVTEPVATNPPAKTETTINNRMTEREMLACVIYQEAGGDAACDECRRRVGDIVLNRMADPRFPDTMYGVLTGKSQYGRFHWTGIVWPGRASNPGEAHAVERAYRIADEILAGQHSDLYGNGYIWQAEFTQGSDGFWHCGHYFAK